MTACTQGIMGKFKRNTAMMTNQGIDVVVNKTGEPLLRLKKHAKPLKVGSTCDKAGTSQSPYTFSTGSLALEHIESNCKTGRR